MHTCVKDVRDEHHRDLLEGIYYGATTAMFILGVAGDGRFRYVGLNPAFMRLTGLSEEQVRDKTPEELVPLVAPQTARILSSHCERCLSEKQVMEYTECLSVHGHEIWWRTRLHPLRDKTGAIYRILGCSKDITRQKNAEKELAAHRIQMQERTASEVRKLLRAVEESPVSVVITDSSGIIEYVNPKFCRVTGYEAREVLGKNPRVLKAGVQDPALYKQMWQAISTGHEWRGEFCNRKKNGELYWERASISPLQDPDGTITHYVAVKEDITEEKRMAQQLERAKEMAQVASKAKSDFLASMSHELRTPLNSIIGFSEVLREQYFGPLNSKQLEYVDDILASGRHLLELINDILDIARIESGKQVLEREMVDIPEIVETGILMIREKAAHHAIRIQTRFCTRCREQGVCGQEKAQAGPVQSHGQCREVHTGWRVHRH
jgi:PAS domain S-box-containing protein